MKFKEGKYYIGDPCYIFEKSWDDVLRKTNMFNQMPPQKLYGKTVFVSNTAYGDGEYTDNENRKYWVDSGLIGILPVSLLEKDNVLSGKEGDVYAGMAIIHFKKDFEVELLEQGIFKFGDIIIDTKNIDTKNENVEEEVD